MSTIPSRTFGPLRRKVTVIGQGTWNMEGDDRPSAIRALRRGLDLGLTHVDTAELYGGGEVEELVAEAIEGRREEVFLVSKVLPSNASRKGAVRACEHSLKRLRTEVLDLYLLHWPGPHPLEETIAAFELLRDEGKIRAYGVSNFDLEDLRSAIELAGPGNIACNQVLYHLGERHIEAELSPMCAEHGVAVVAYSPFGSGDFPSATSRGGKVLQEVADAHGASPRQVALAFLTRDPNTFAIPKASSVSHVEDNAMAAKLRLTKEELSRIDEAFPLKKRRELPVI